MALGCFPLDYRPYHRKSVYRRFRQFWARFTETEALNAYTIPHKRYLYLSITLLDQFKFASTWSNPQGPPSTECIKQNKIAAAALYSNRFRGEPAIPGPESFFSANLSSSQNIATFTGSGLRGVRPCSPWPKLDRPASGLIKITIWIRLFKTRFR
jgi:hypothetical protein